MKRGRHVTLRLLWLEWKQDHPDGWGHSQFCWHYHRWLGAQDVVMRLNYPAGARMLVDYSGDRVPVVDPGTGEVSQAEVFVATLGCSGMLFAEASASQDLPSWLMAHVHAYETYGGVSEATTPGQPKSGGDPGLLLRPRGQRLLCRAGPPLWHGNIADPGRAPP
jgi:transposase